MATTAGSAPTAPYPLRFSIDYPDQGLDRLSSAFRLLWIIPIAAVIGAIGGGGASADFGGDGLSLDFGGAVFAGLGGGGTLFLGLLLMILFRTKYPRWWFDWNREFFRFSARVGAYLALLRDEYPSTDEQQAVHVEIDYPDVERDLNRWLPLVKWLLAIPHYVVLIFLGIAALFAVVFAWFAILFTGRYSRGLFDFVVGVGRWSYRVQAYAFLLVTDRYPPFSVDP